MLKEKIITSSQLFCLLLISKIVISITFGPAIIGKQDFWDYIISSIISYFITFIMVIPVYFLHKINPEADGPIFYTKKVFGDFSRIFVIFYAFYFTLVCLHLLFVFKNFIENVMNPPISFSLLLIILIILTCYGAYKGIEGIARAGSIIIFFMFISIIFLGFSLFKNLDYTNFKPFFYNGIEETKSGIIFFLSRSSCISAMLFLFHSVKGDLKKGIFIWNTIFYLLIITTIIFVIGSLGDFAKTRLFPVYSASSITKVLSLENLDSIYLGLWVCGIFIKLSLFINLLSECVKEVFNQKNNRTNIPFLCIFLIFLSVFLKVSNLFSGIFSINFLFVLTLIASFLIPLFLLMCYLFKNRAIKKV
ncbi:MAG: GerAB/ArcD/ProY family transporter [Candidatus Improbicoccus pseudotrichonymphae]|uniref:GerAB/ArcD/ProY family transporter n=1 Tax=Candidatus Improbicoccus pseudotrichonymphae TaxID=3033792 RepID=A0AA48KY62_9FIRM|nr:MAG: GerAB/ArcD/ProY family transporter [Candidatus Improbicoccus pseudotrichonymphae]